MKSCMLMFLSALALQTKFKMMDIVNKYPFEQGKQKIIEMMPKLNSISLTTPSGVLTFLVTGTGISALSKNGTTEYAPIQFAKAVYGAAYLDMLLSKSEKAKYRTYQEKKQKGEGLENIKKLFILKYEIIYNIYHQSFDFLKYGMKKTPFVLPNGTNDFVSFLYDIAREQHDTELLNLLQEVFDETE